MEVSSLWLKEQRSRESVEDMEGGVRNQAWRQESPNSLTPLFMLRNRDPRKKEEERDWAREAGGRGKGQALLKKNKK